VRLHGALADDALTPDITLQGWSSRGEGGARLARYLHDGSFAELMRVPTENVFPLPTVAGDDPARWAALTVHAISYVGLLAGGLAAGETLLVSGATGNLGSSAVALAMGAGRRGRPRAATRPRSTSSPTGSVRVCARSR
jgi:alcohol dehydrogenase